MSKPLFQRISGLLPAALVLLLPLLFQSCFTDSKQEVIVLAFNLDSAKLGKTDSLRFEIYNGDAPGPGDTAKPVQVVTVKTPKGSNQVEVKLSDKVQSDFSVVVIGFDSTGAVQRKLFEFQDFNIDKGKAPTVLLATITTADMGMRLGEVGAVALTLLPADAADKRVAVASLDTSVVRIVGADKDSVLALKVGTAVVTVTAVVGGAQGRFTITVTSAKGLKAISAKSLSGLVGIALDPELTFDPADAENKAFTLKSLDTAIVAVAGSQVVGKAAGKAMVEVTTADGGLKDTFEVTVSRVAIRVKGVQGQALRGLVGDTLVTELAWDPADATDRSFSLRSLDSATVRVLEEKLVLLKLGQASVVVTSADGGFRDTFQVSVASPEFKPDVLPITTLKCAPCHVPGTALNFQDSITILLNGSKVLDRLERLAGDPKKMPVNNAPNGDLSAPQLAVVLEWLNARVVRLKGVTVANDSIKLGESKDPAITWDPPNATNKSFTLSSLDTSIVGVEGEKMVGKALGQAQLQVRVLEGDRLITFTVKVQPVLVDSIHIPDTTATVGDTLVPAIHFFPPNATNQAYSLSKLRPASTITTVLPGKRIVANTLGKDTLVATSADGSKVDQFTVTVGPVLPTALSGQDTNVTVGGLLVTPRLTWVPANTTNKGYRLFIAPADTLVAAVRTTGLQLQGKTVGQVNVTAISLADSTIRGTFKFTVGPVVVVSLSAAATVTYPDSTVDPVITWNPANATNKAYTLTSLDTTKVKIVANRALIRKLGAATVTITSADGNKTAAWNLTVIRSPFTAPIKPIISLYCGGCHNATHAPTNWQDSTTAVLNRAEMLRRTGLPLTHLDHMPPDGATQPPLVDLTKLRNWLSQE